jgi:hypothetical protein
VLVVFKKPLLQLYCYSFAYVECKLTPCSKYFRTTLVRISNMPFRRPANSEGEEPSDPENYGNGTGGEEANPPEIPEGPGQRTTEPVPE